MRMTLPSLKVRRRIDQYFMAFFETEKRRAFQLGLSEWCEFYQMPQPKVSFHKRMRGTDAGRTTEDGRVELHSPAGWKALPDDIVKTPERWLRTLYHELAHYLFWSERELKANRYAGRFVKGVR